MNIKTAIPAPIRSKLAVIKSHRLLTSVKKRARSLDPAFTPPKQKSMFFWPELPKYYFEVMYKLCRLLELRPTIMLPREQPDDRTYEFPAFLWFYEDCLDTNLPSLRPNASFINGLVTDISKPKVDHVASRVLGYALAIDPVQHSGLAVRKSIRNAAHDGSVISCPHAPEAGYVYQYVVDNQEGTEVIDLRVPLIGNAIPFVYEKRRPIATRFSNNNSSVSIHDPLATFSQNELNSLHHFREAFGLEFGEIDVLRDRTTRRIYIVDVNRTPSGPPNGLPREDVLDALILLAAQFEQQFLASSAFAPAAGALQKARNIRPAQNSESRQ